jgi:TPR repeat protein
VAQPIFTVKYTLLLTAILLTSWGGVAHLVSQPRVVSAPAVEAAPATPETTSLENADDQVDQALQYSLDGKYFDAANILIPLAQRGFSRAQLYLAVAYYHGHGVSRDRKKAEQMFFDLRNKNYEPGIVNTYLNLLGSLPPV